ncbi:alanine/glycine:cation symporter family protein [Planctomicrobium piriforme]|uniref:Na+/alanine symporter n=1 Tax=Planctomicrobium piriforme TaxID=1576369 RepID=A0A1I3IAD2_9PLAN|nr:alanine/glycine:cation symporter family protein [Planctomicrobium piriforme]SFI44733.1 Na+/alanine symporter [Planctomicrobium piriforme]
MSTRRISVRWKRHLSALMGWLLCLLSVGTLAAEEVVETPPPLPLTSRLDLLFQKTVSLLDKVIFYRLGRTERLSVTIAPEVIYVRDRGTSGPFERLGAADNQLPTTLTASELDLWSAGKKLLPGITINGQRQDYRWGQLGDRLVDYVTVKFNPPAAGPVRYGDVFIADSDGKTFRQRGRSPYEVTDVAVSRETVASWASQGWLAAPANPVPGETLPVTQESIGGVPLIVAWLSIGALFYTLYLRGVNIWGFRHAIEIVSGRYDNPAETGEVTHFQALSSALAGTLGLGNIAGVTIAMTIGGPGAFFWMLVSGFIGMAAKFAECTLGLKYREILSDGTVLGGPMQYLRRGFADRGFRRLGGVLAVVFCIMCILGSIGGGNMLQANLAAASALHLFQDAEYEELGRLTKEIEAAVDSAQVGTLQQQRNALRDRMTSFTTSFNFVYGGLLAACVGLVIIGGIKRIGQAAERIVPAMCVLYSGACLFIIFKHFGRIPEVISEVWADAFTGSAVSGGIIGVMVIGTQRAAFSNEAGTGSAPIAHSAARTEEPVREGCVALLEPFIDTIVVCSMTALVILITGAWNHAEWVHVQGLSGSALTSRAFGAEIAWFPYVLAISITLFAYSTILSWSYYGERSWVYLFGARSTLVYKTLAVSCTFFGTLANLGSVLDFSDMMILGMGFPNILGILLLAPEVRRDLLDYWSRYRSGQFPIYKQGHLSSAASTRAEMAGD